MGQAGFVSGMGGSSCLVPPVPLVCTGALFFTCVVCMPLQITGKMRKRAFVSAMGRNSLSRCLYLVVFSPVLSKSLRIMCPVGGGDSCLRWEEELV